MDNYTGLEIAVIGLSGRFPEADNVQQFWNNLIDGKNSIAEFSDAELLEAGESERMIKNPHYVKFGSYLKNKKYFDSSFFDYRPAEAEVMDPQIRLFHECCWEALEDSGYSNNSKNEKIGLFASGSPRLPWKLYALLKGAEDQAIDDLSAQQLSGITFLSSLISYKLNLGGPVMFLQTACSSSLAAIHQACNSILLGECKIALAGGVTVNNFSKKGYLHEDGHIQSADGKCCPFDHKASGTIFGEGAGVVVLKRLRDALKDQDNIYAVIKGSAINNDGNKKVGYTAPSVSGQVEVISKAIRNAKIEPDSISYVEAHGTGTKLGDPIEIEALSHAFRLSGSKNNQYCALGSVKSNVGHLDAASGVVGLIKVVMALKNRQLPATLHYEKPNPNIELENSPFFINSQLRSWRSSSYPLRAGVSSLGIGGTNVHVILEEAPDRKPSSEGRPYQLLTLSAKTITSLRGNIKKLQKHLEEHPEEKLADVAYSLNACRSTFDKKAIFVCDNRDEAIRLLSVFDEKKAFKVGSKGKNTIAFMFPGQGAQSNNMYAELYACEPTFREEVDKCFSIVQMFSSKKFQSVLFSASENRIHDTEYTQPILFIVEYSLARLLMSWGVRPDIMIGHSIGEYVAACLGGVFSLEDALKLVVKRGELMQQMSKGNMLSVMIHEDKLALYLEKHPQVSLAAVNSHSSCVISGPFTAVERFKETIEREGFVSKELQTSHAFHSHMMDDILDNFEQVVKQVELKPQEIPFISNLTGKKASDKQICNPKYWVDHLRQTVRFSDGISEIMRQEEVLFVEIGPGRALGSFVGASNLRKEGHVVININGQSKRNNSLQGILTGLGKLWSHGVILDWESFYQHETRHVKSLPTYTFDRSVYAADVDPERMIEGMITDKSLVRNPIDNWYYTPTWKLSSVIPWENGLEAGWCTIVFEDKFGAGESIIENYRQRGEKVISIRAGKKYRQTAGDFYEVDPENKESFAQLFDHLATINLLPNRIVYCLSVTEETASPLEKLRPRDLNFFGLMHTFQLAQQFRSDLKEIVVLTAGMYNITCPGEISSIPNSAIIGLLKVIGQEYPTITTGQIDISISELTNASFKQEIFTEVNYPVPGKIVSYRSGCRWTRHYDMLSVENKISNQVFRKQGIYLITGGLGGFGYTMSKYLARNHQAKLVLLGRERLPRRPDWPDLLKSNTISERIKEKIRKISSIESEGGEVVYFECDLSCADRFSEVIGEVGVKFGKLNGVFHAAGVTSGPSINSLDKLEKADFETQFHSKVDGLFVLHEVLKDKELDFCLLTSSLAAILGGLGFGGYASASVFMDFFTSILRGHGLLKNWISINFDGINFEEEWSEMINEHELPAVVERLISLKALPQLVVSTKDLQTRLDGWVSKITQSEGGRTLGDVQVDELEDQELSDTERKLLKTWMNFFGKTDFGLDDDFFEIGGDSLKALTLNARISREMNISLSLSDFFDQPTIRSLAAFISQSHELESVSKDPIEPALEKDHYILSPSQKRLYFLYELDNTSRAYNVHQVLRLEGKLDKDKLIGAFQKLIDRHEILRTSFHMIDGQPVQTVEKNVHFEIAYFEALEEKAEAIIQEFIRPFDLSQTPLLRTGLIRLSDENHLLMVDMHHIVTDGVSQGVLIRDFMDYYSNVQLPPLQLHYKDFSEWVLLQQEYFGRQRDFWKQEFAEYATALELPTDYPRPVTKSYKGSNKSFLIGEEDTRKIKALGEAEGATLFMTMLSILNVFLAKLSNQSDVTVGTGVAGRDHADLENIMGMFVNTLAIRNFPKGNKTFRMFLSEVKKKTLACLENQSFPYEALIEELSLPRDTSRNPLFDVALTFQNFEQEELVIPGLKLQPYDYTRDVSKFDIELTVGELNGMLYLDFEYATDLFTERTIDKFVSYFQRIVKVIIEDPDQQISQIKILSREQHHELLYEFNTTTFDYSSDKTIIDLFTEQVSINTNKTAVSFFPKALSYQELDEKCTQVAVQLKTMGINSDHLVGVLLEPSELLLVSVLGVFKAGAAFVPIDKSYPSARINYMVKSSGLKALITTSELLKAVTDISEHLPPENILDLEALTWNSIEQKIDLPKVTPDDLAYVLYTSGSTGHPKGVMITHGSLFNYLSWARDTYIRNEKCQMALFSSISFDLTITSMFLPLVSGNHLHVYKAEEQSALIRRVISNRSVDVVKLTPAHLRMIKEMDLDLTHVKRFVVGGEQLSTDLAVTIQDRGSKSLEIYNEYGPTEATIGCILHKFNRKEDNKRSSVLIGKPAPNTRIYILDSELQVCPQGVAGEIYIAGSQVTKGYIFSEELTRMSLIENPYSNGELMYKTGDLARWHSDGSIEFLGRVDDQVKIRGYRIELGEIASQLSMHEKVQDAVVVTKEGGEDSFLVGYYVAKEPVDSEDLKEHLALQLPEYMVPNQYLRLENMPLTSNGKVDHKALPEPEAATKEDYVEPRTKEEQILCDVWAKVLGKEKLSITDDFFTIGGDSIRSIQICSRMKGEGYRLTVKDIITCRNIQSLSLVLKAQVGEGKKQETVTGSVPLTGIQHWFFERPLKARHHFNQAVLLSFPEKVTEADVREIFTKIQSHHDALRITYKISEGTVGQYNHGLNYPLSIMQWDLTNEEFTEEQFMTVCNELQSSINLEQGPLMKLGLFDLVSGSRLLIVIHHLVVDGISWRILFDDIETLYKQIRSGEKLTLPQKTDSFLLWATKLQDYMKSDRYSESVFYWNTILDKPQIAITKDYPEGTNTTSDIAIKGFILDKALTNKLLSQVNRPFNTQINDILLAAFLLSVQKHYGQGALRVDLEGHGREEILEGVDVSRTVGWFTSIYPVLLEHAEDGLLSLIKTVKESLRKIPNNGIDYLIGQYMGSDIVSSEGSIISFNYLGQFDSDTEDRIYKVTEEATGNTVSVREERVYVWDIVGMITGGQLHLQLSYSNNQYKEATIHGFMTTYEGTLESLIDFCSNYDRKVLTPSDLTFNDLSMAQLDNLQDQFKITDVYPLSPMQEGLLFHALLDEQAEHYFNQLSYRLCGEINITFIEHSLNEIMSRYDILRTIFLHKEYDRPIQVVLSNRKGDFSFQDIREEVLESDRKTVVQKYRELDRSAKFRLSKDVLMRVKVYQTGDEDYEFIWSFHHILMDGWCVSIIVNEFNLLYQNFLDRGKISLPAVQPYSRYINWLEKRDKEASVNYWKNYLAGYSNLVSPPYNKPKSKNFRLDTLSLILDEIETNSLKQISATHGVTINSIIQCAWGILLAKYNNTNDVVFGSVVSGRPAELDGIENMVGLFINTIPVRISYEDDTIKDLLEKVQRNATEGEMYHYLPLSTIQAVSGWGAALVDHILVFENYPVTDEIEGMDLEKGTGRVVDLEVFEQTSYDLSLIVMPGDNININFDYNANRFSAETIEGMKDHLATVIEQIENYNQRVSEIDILSFEEREQLL
ncbi:hybrid non-ribosomal peptide synthetase/type I polyketide synthase, partial [Fulvivirga imtechensis]|uniref:hybrid non-ribosomal peptide synthetase/type I polyketide synthase n=1 Tax=Fulvivirga imtechensis TaxID=881893 RepID=UPI000590ECBA